MYHPTSRVLAVLELLQARPSITGPEIAARLEMDVRTVRRYITHLQDVGIPVEANIGRHGGYRLRPGFKLPPLMLTEEEATAVVLGLLGSSWLDIGQDAIAIEGALAKVTRVLPPHVRDRLKSISSHLVLFPPKQAAPPAVSLLMTLSEAIGQQQRVVIDYRSFGDGMTHRTVEPYGMVGWDGRWYLVGYCLLRKGHRTFRIDRIEKAEILAEHFEIPEGFDSKQYVKERYSQAGGYQIEVEFQAPLYTVQQKIPSSYGQISATPTGTLYQCQYEDINEMARYLMGLNFPFVVHQPPELREALLQLADEMVRIANIQAP